MFEDDDNFQDPKGFNTVVELESGGMGCRRKWFCFCIHSPRLKKQFLHDIVNVSFLDIVMQEIDYENSSGENEYVFFKNKALEDNSST